MKGLSWFVRTGIRRPVIVLPYLLDAGRSCVRWLRYRRRPYHEFYERRMRDLAASDPRAAVGGRWLELGRIQFEYLVAEGLLPTHRFLDFGCGCLRGGLHFIAYLHEGNYHGVDISEEILDAGRRFLAEARLEGKRPVLRRSAQGAEAFEGTSFDVVLAQSVFTHMPIGDVETCLAGVRRALAPGGRFYATFNDGRGSAIDYAVGTFYHPFEAMAEAGARQGLAAERMVDYPHPDEQSMMRFTQAHRS